MTWRCAEIEPRIDALADGELPAGERAEVEAHLAGCAGCRKQLDDALRVKSLVAGAWPALEPRPGDVERVLAAARGAQMQSPVASDPRSRVSTPQVQPPIASARRRAPLRLATAAGVAAAAVGLVVGTLLRPAGVSLAYAPGIFVHFEPAPAPARPELDFAPVVAPIPRNLTGVLGADRVPLTAAERAALAAGRTIWRPAREADFAAFYARGDELGVAPLFTADLGFAILSRALAAADERLEEEVVRPETIALARALRSALERDLGRAGGAEARAAVGLARDVVAVGLALAEATAGRSPERDGGGEAAGAPLSPRALAELDAIRAAEGVRRSPLTGALEDYAAYGALAPRDRAIAWFARSRLPLDRPETAASALAIVHALAAPDDPTGAGGPRPLERYERIRERLAFFRGAPDDWAPERLLPALRRLQGGRLRLDDIPAVAAKIAAAGLDAPEIPGPNGMRPLFSLLGTRWNAEARAIAAATGPRRLLGSGLDLLRTEDGGAARPAHDDDLFSLVAHARTALDLREAGRTTSTALLTIQPLALRGRGPWTPGAPAVAAVLAEARAEARRPEAAVDAAPEFFSRLGALSRAVAAALRAGDPTPSRDALALEFDALADLFAALAAGDAAVAARAPALAAALAPAPPAAVVPLNIVVRPGDPPQAGVSRPADIFHARVIRGPIEVLSIWPPRGTRAAATEAPVLVRGAALAPVEIPFERRIGASDVPLLPEMPVPPWLRSWRVP